MAKDFILLTKFETRTRFHPPLGLLYIGGVLEKHGYDVEIFHEVGNKGNIQKLIWKVISNNPLYVGFSSMTSSALKPTIEASKRIKEYVSQCIIVWGGVHPTFLPLQCLREDYIDIVVIGEGEKTAIELTKQLSTNGDLKKVRGIGYKHRNEPRITGPREFLSQLELDGFNPAWHLINMEKYFQKLETEKRVLPVVTSRGCPHACTFCYNLVVNKRKWRAHSAKKVLSMINELKENYSVDGVMFYDDNFFVDKNRAIKILRGIKMPWWGEIRADYIDESMAKEMYLTNCRGIFVGAESADIEMLKLLNKETTPEQVLNCVKLCKKYDIRTELSIMIGLPGESQKSREKTLNFIDKVIKTYSKTKVSLKIYTPYPGTPLFYEAVKCRFHPPKRTENWVTFERFRCNNPWVKDPKILETMCRVCHIANDNKYRYLRFTLFQKAVMKLLEPIERVRWKYRYFNHPYEIKLLTSLNLML